MNEHSESTEGRSEPKPVCNASAAERRGLPTLATEREVSEMVLYTIHGKNTYPQLPLVPALPTSITLL